mgnify:CR=1 FL=1
MGEPEIFLIYARALNGTIGKDGTMPWHLSEDLKRFKALTMGHPMVMGRKTYESFGRPLPGRRHIVMTRDPGWSGPQAEVVRSVGEALDLAMHGNDSGQIAIVGGAETYAQFLPLAHRVEVTEIQQDYHGDTHVPHLGEEWVESVRERHHAEGDQPAYHFVTYLRQGAA